MALLQVISTLIGIVALVCYILVIVKMFQDGKVGLAIASLVLFLCVIGYFIAFVVGWMNADRWGIRNIMLLWTLCLIVNIVCFIVFAGMGALRLPPMPAH